MALTSNGELRALIQGGMMAIATICSIFSKATLSLPDSPYSLLGIAPQDEKYFAGESIACKDGSKFFGRDRLNDGFCDCPDGTDEPGTSACPEGRFYCRNLNEKPIFLFSSRVNDHICDCCDGSDEYDGRTTCPNTCSEDAYFLRQSATHDWDVHRKIVNLDDLILGSKELWLALFVELFVAIGGVTFCIIRFRNKLKTRRQRPRS